MIVAPSSQQMISGNQQLPDKLKNSCVLLTFAHPIRSSSVGEFFRIHLTEQMQGDGEESFYLAEQFQPHRVTDHKLCPRCAQRLDRIAQSIAVCRNSRCPNQGEKVYIGPVRGVIQVMVFPDFVVDRVTETIRVPDPSYNPPKLEDFLHRRVMRGEFRRTPMVQREITIELVNRCLLVLDRRYNDRTLAAVYRTAGEICDIRGWKLAE